MAATTPSMSLPEDIADFISLMARQGWIGGNVTIPHKEHAFRAAVRRDAAAEAIGAVNTLWLENGKVSAETPMHMVSRQISTPERRAGATPKLPSFSARVVPPGPSYLRCRRPELQTSVSSIARASGAASLAQLFGSGIGGQ